jgi:preprotein translocase subunit SecG
MIFGILLVLFLIVCIFLCFLVLIQSDKGGGISGAIGGGLGNASNVLGTQDTANILTRGTAIFAAAFMALCVIMSFLLAGKTEAVEKSVLEKRAEKQESYTPSSALQGQGLPLQQQESEKRPESVTEELGENEASGLQLPTKPAEEAKESDKDTK